MVGNYLKKDFLLDIGYNNYMTLTIFYHQIHVLNAQHQFALYLINIQLRGSI